MSEYVFTKNREVQKIIKKLNESHGDTKFSNIIDDAGNQYVDIVMEGGGVLGIALVGYFYVLEEMGIRFLGIGGTSAGSITALLLAGLGTPDEKKSGKIIKLLNDMDMKSFVDGDDDVQDFIGAWLKKANKLWLLIKGGQVIDTIKESFGLNPGKVFEDWLTTALSENGITTTQALESRMKTIPKGLREREGKPIDNLDEFFNLVLISTDVTTGTLVKFPDMANLYWENPDKVNPAKFVRASMSIPFFFYPFQAMPSNIQDPEERRKRWQEFPAYERGIPDTCYLVDGGMVSNFPIGEFHDNTQVPVAPTFGVKLGLEWGEAIETKSVIDFGVQSFNAARNALDTDFINEHPDYQHLVQQIDTSEHNWLNFSMSQTEKVKLFIKGVKAADYFLSHFNWEKYRALRKHMTEAHSISKNLEQEREE